MGRHIFPWISLKHGKEGAPYQYPETLMIFLGYIYILLALDYRNTRQCQVWRANRTMQMLHMIQMKIGYEKWRDKYEYGKRWYSEIPHSVIKGKCGEFVRATKEENIS